jgi:hypothetical protein
VTFDHPDNWKAYGKGNVVAPPLMAASWMMVTATARWLMV